MMSQYTRDYEDGRKARTHGIPFNWSKTRGWRFGWLDKDNEIALLLQRLGV